MKTITVHHQGSFIKFPGFPLKYLYAVTDKGLLEIYERDKDTGSETLRAVFKDWEYLEITSG